MGGISFTVIVVEDEKLIMKNIIKNIERANTSFEVVATASNGEEAWELVQEYQPNVVFTDIRMPVMDGLELIQRIRKKYDFIACVVLSGYDDFTYAREAIKNQAVDYLLKPVNLEELTGVLARIEQELLAKQEKLTGYDSYRKPEEIVDLVIEYIHQHYMQTIDLSEISSQFGFSMSYLTKIFTRQMEMPPTKYIREYRINLAKQLLRNQSLSISEVGELVGYPDQFHFSKIFKQVTGKSPSEYRS
ncbi:response regulator transcription factor [Diplocloster agilis]|uniref:response regulator transcription factor n=1 Tax=Diplocloster agilis TaxID=2850323 RepID=UPI0008209127|nr:response regulator [Suonthocola fibrivorans]MCU6735368.1 response regulator [Suonthocola fibrivorans]SCJ72014.1 Uncharacterized response regulatory protein SA0215 [uncultured Clostridium sp.]